MSKDGREAQQFQFNLELYDERPEILKKPVQAVHMAIAGGVQNKTQRLAFNAMLKHAHDIHARNPNKNFDTYEISRVELCEMIGYQSKNRKHLKDVLKQMQSLTVEWDILRQDGEATWASCVLVPMIGFDKDKVFYSYAPHIKPMLFDPKTYARLDLRIQRQFALDCSAALYEWCNRFRKVMRTNTMPWEQWRWVIYGAVDESSILNEYKLFKREKLKPAITEINQKSDLEIVLIETKEGGRKIKNLQFMVQEKSLFVESDESTDRTLELDKQLEDLGVNARDRKKILSKYGPEVIEAHIRYTQRRLGDTTKEEIKNVGKYFVNAIENGYANDLVKKELEPTLNVEGWEEIVNKFREARNKDAEKLFKELDIEEQESLISEFNDLQETKALNIPTDPKKRTKRYMAPLNPWYAQKTWGDPKPES
jgi:plasmid replication initiation protein